MRRLDRPLDPGSTIGILGGGQLGRMLALAAAELGLKCHIYAPPGDNPATHVAAATTEAPWDDGNALKRFADLVDVVTYEFENIPLQTARLLETLCPLAPGVRALEVSQHRAVEKSFFNDLGIATADWLHLDDIDEAAARTAAWFDQGQKVILKTCRLGYDGKGQARAASVPELRAAWPKLGGIDLIIERQVPFTREISVIAARAADGNTALFDVPENTHQAGILRTSRVPAPVSADTVSKAHAIALEALTALDYTGILAIELFIVETDGTEQLLVNEFAPRVHNSGHWTQDACTTTQFHQHIRAVAGWPLGDPTRHTDCVMTNLIGDDVAPWQNGRSAPGAAVHIYGKSATRPGRKMGHVNRVSPRLPPAKKRSVTLDSRPAIC